MPWLRCAPTGLGHHHVCCRSQHPELQPCRNPPAATRALIVQSWSPSQQPSQGLSPVQAGRPEAVTPSLVQDIGQQWSVNPSSALVPELRHTYEAMIEKTMPPASQPLAYAALHALTCACRDTLLHVVVPGTPDDSCCSVHVTGCKFSAVNLKYHQSSMGRCTGYW